MKKKQCGSAAVETTVLILVLLAIIGWVMNIIKLSECDFETPYKAEVIHTIGILPPVGAVAGWLDVGK